MLVPCFYPLLTPPMLETKLEMPPLIRCYRSFMLPKTVNHAESIASIMDTRFVYAYQINDGDPYRTRLSRMLKTHSLLGNFPEADLLDNAEGGAQTPDDASMEWSQNEIFPKPTTFDACVCPLRQILLRSNSARKFAREGGCYLCHASYTVLSSVYHRGGNIVIRTKICCVNIGG